MPLQDVTKTLFDERVGENFTLEASEGCGIELQLVSVQGLGGPAAAADRKVRESFSAVWCAPHNTRLPQKIYRITHEQVGSLELFLVPIGPDPEGRGMRMEAVFNFRS